jgi:ABC-2 type transport system ATP-binding protein
MSPARSSRIVTSAAADRAAAPPTPDGIGLLVSGLAFRYPGQEQPVLRDVSFRVLPGRALGILGPNGAGKSTLMSALLQIRKGRRQGAVQYDSADGIPPHDVGYATQDIALYHTLSVKENLRHIARTVLPWGEARVAVERTLAEFRLERHARRQVHELSGGQQRLAHLAASFVHDPALRLLDEPTAGLDFETRATLVDLVQRWRTEGRCVLLCSHYPEDLQEMCTDALLVVQGTAHELGSIADMLAGREPELVLRFAQPPELRLPARATVADLRTALMSRDDTDRLREAHAAKGSLREFIQADPRFRELLDD